MLVADAGSYESPPTLMQGFDGRVVVCADLEPDGDDDAFITRGSETGVLALISDADSSGTSFPNGLTDSVELVPPNVAVTPEPEQHAWPLICDLDGDGDRDLFLALEYAQRIGMIDGELIPSDGRIWLKLVARAHAPEQEPAALEINSRVAEWAFALSDVEAEAVAPPLTTLLPHAPAEPAPP